MKRKSIIPYGEISIMAIANMSNDTKFQLVAKVKKFNKTKIVLTDDLEDLELVCEDEDVQGLDVGSPVMLFGEKIGSKIKKDRIIRLNLDWNLYLKTCELETR